MKNVIEYTIYNWDTQCNKKLMKLAKIKLPKKQVINFKAKKGWTVYTHPVMEFNIGKRTYSLAFLPGKDKVELTTFVWGSKKKNGDVGAITDYRQVEF